MTDRADMWLRAHGVTVNFGGLVAVDNVSVELDRGEVVGLIGPNGAGKTTFFGAVLGTTSLVAGTVHLDGVDVTNWSPHRRARAGLGRTFQKLEMFGSMTVRENLLLATEGRALGEQPWRLLTLRRHQHRSRVEEMLGQLGIADVADRPARTLPLGRARLLDLGRALCAQPSVLLLDEPSSGLDPLETHVLAEHVRRAVDDLGIGVLLIEHDMAMVTDICERLYVLDFGRLLARGPTAEVTRLNEVRDAYLGVFTE